MATDPKPLSRPSLHAAIDACPEAFAAVDTELLVVEWNRAAERLTGYPRADVLGGPLPHLTPAQRVDLESSLVGFDRWSADVPVVLPRVHADGRIINVSVTAYTRLTDTDGTHTGYASFFREVRAGDPRTHLRNIYTRSLAQSVRQDEVTQSLEVAVRDLLRSDTAFLLCRADGRWRSDLATGAPTEVAETLVVLDEDVLERALEAGAEAAVVRLLVSGEERSAEIVVASRGEVPCVMAMLDSGLDLADPEAIDLAIAIAAEAFAALRRVEAVRELEGKVEILEAIAEIARAAPLDYAAMAGHIARHAARALSCERAAVYGVEPGSDRLTLEAFHSEDRTWDTSDEVHAAGRAAAAEMLAQVEPFVAQDARACGWLRGPWDHEAGAVSVYGIPLLIGVERIGLLVVAHTTANPRGFTSLCTQVGAALARQAALALANARLLESQVEANRVMQEGNRQRADYVEGITHDLRTPITAILGFAKTLQRAEALLRPEDRAEALATIERQAIRISRMLDDMMDSARAEAGELRPDRLGPVALHRIVEEAMLTVTPEQRALLTSSGDREITAHGDADQLVRVVQNLVANALRYAAGESGVEICVARDGSLAQLLVVDHGPGLPEGLDVFGRFARGDSRGTGLGLYTVKTIVEAHGGRIELRATPGGGTTVDVRLPLSTSS